MNGPPPRPRDAGVTLVELMVVLAVLAVVATLTTTSMMTLLRSTDGVRSRNEVTQQLRVATDAIARDVRSAARPEGHVGPIVRRAEADRLTLTTLLGAEGEPRWVDIRLLPTGRLLEEVRTRAPDGRYLPANRISRRTLADGVVPGSAPLFQYFSSDESGNRVPLSLQADGRLSGEDLDRLELVLVTLAVAQDGGRVADTSTEVTTEVRLVNVQLERR